MSDDKRLERIELKIDDLSDHLAGIDVTLAAQHVSLREHIRRTTILEEELKPVKKHIDRVEGALKLIGGLSILGGVIAALKSLV